MTEIIDGTAVDVTPTSAVTTVQQGVQTFDAPSRDPLRALGRMTEAEYGAEVKAIIAGTNRMMQLQKDLLREDVDYGVIPGTAKPTLLQPGAERLAMFHRLIPEHIVARTVTPVPGHPERIDIDATCRLHLGSIDGPVLQTSHATCSTYEDRYRWRTLERTCPTCQKPAIIKGNPKYGGGWVCWKKKDGCGANFPDDYGPITSQTVGKVENEEPWALLNTITQIAQKRAFVAGVRHALGITDLFTEEIEEPGAHDEGQGASQTAAAPAATTSRPSAPPRAPSAPVASTPAPTGPAGAVFFEGPVMRTPEGTKQTASGRVLAFAIKVGNAKHNIDLWDEMATAALPHITEGARIRVDGRRVEKDWPGRGDKPMMKVIEDVTVVALVDEQGARVIAQATEKAPQPVQQTLAPAPADDGPPLFDDDELGAPVAAELVKATGDPKATADVTGTIRSVGWKQTPGGADYVSIELVNGGLWYDVAVGKDDALLTISASVGSAISVEVGQAVRVMGGWSKSGALIIAGIVAPVEP